MCVHSSWKAYNRPCTQATATFAPSRSTAVSSPSAGTGCPVGRKVMRPPSREGRAAPTRTARPAPHRFWLVVLSSFVAVSQPHSAHMTGLLLEVEFCQRLLLVLRSSDTVKTHWRNSAEVGTVISDEDLDALGVFTEPARRRVYEQLH